MTASEAPLPAVEVATGGSGSSRPPLDSEFFGQAIRGLRTVSIAIACTSGGLLGLTAATFLLLGSGEPAHLSHFLAAQAVLCALSLAMALLCGSRLSPVRVLACGRGYQVLGALLIAFCAFQGEDLLQSVMVKLSWLAIWILLFPLFVPGRLSAHILAGIASASTAPIVFFLWAHGEGHGLPSAMVLAGTFLPYYVCALLGTAPAAYIYRLGASASSAREQVRRLGSYQLLELLGTGGMGEVWRADHSLLARPAAIKLIRERRDQTPEDRQQAMSRFEREAQATAALSCPHTVSLFDYGVTQDGTRFYVMELLEGVDLGTLVSTCGPVPADRAVHFLLQMCESLREAHGAGLVHRDIKPANVMACLVGGRWDFVKLLDFGLVGETRSKVLTEIDVDDEDLVGTPAFMSPEAIRSGPVRESADLYALGCLGYWLLTGVLVFEKGTVGEMLEAHLKDPPSPPSSRVEHSIPSPLEALILDCLAKAPEQRPGSAAELATALRATGLAATWTPTRAEAWWEANGPTLTASLPAASAASWSSVGLSWLHPALARADTESIDYGPAQEKEPPIRSPSSIRIAARVRAATARGITPSEFLPRLAPPAPPGRSGPPQPGSHT